ncbi:DUF2804 domain-containing protein [Vibrio sp. JPW-9-11-11]|nr:DUF2804 domain-containing protein [Vibrio sp. JPW-9-11-11]NVD08690.1 DUF2804 domain-containing protein [Vibrio sp. JPW-9-11-11]
MSTPSQIECVINAEGAPTFGYYDAIPQSLGVDHFDYRDGMDKRASRFAKYFHYKQFQFVSVFTDRYVIGVALADIRYLVSGFCYVYDKHNDTLVEQNWLRPFSITSHMSASSFDGTSSIAGGAIRFDIHQGVWRVGVNAPQVQCDILIKPPTTHQPLALCTPTGYSGWTYTQKHNALAVGGQLRIQGKEVDLSQARAGYDFSAGYMRRETSWRWASISATCDAVSLGLNLAAGVNETGGSENTLWIDGRRHLLSPVHFHYKRDERHQPWRITSQDGRIDLTFVPLNLRSEKLNLGVLKSNFRQFIGHFSGEITDSDGITHHLDHVVGLTEDHFAKW